MAKFMDTDESFSFIEALVFTTYEVFLFGLNLWQDVGTKPLRPCTNRWIKEPDLTPGWPLEVMDGWPLEVMDGWP